MGENNENVTGPDYNLGHEELNRYIKNIKTYINTNNTIKDAKNST